MSVDRLISRKVRAIRLEKGLSQRQLAKTTGFQERFLSQIENKPRHLSTRTLERLASGLGVTIAELVSDDGTATKAAQTLPRELGPGIDESIRVLRVLRTRVGKK